MSFTAVMILTLIGTITVYSILYTGSIEYRAELKLSYYVRPFPGLLFSFFSDN